jgi:D-alanyl-D-alanine carboxypeptidase
MLFLKNFLIVIGLAIGVLILVIIWQVMPWNKSNLVSPVQSSKVAFSENIWIPKLFKSFGLVQPGPEVSARAAFFVDLKSGKSLYEKNIDEQMPIASLTKIMTAIIVLEHKDWEDKFYVSPTAAATEPDKMYLKASELLTRN